MGHNNSEDTMEHLSSKSMLHLSLMSERLESEKRERSKLRDEVRSLSDRLIDEQRARAMDQSDFVTKLTLEYKERADYKQDMSMVLAREAKARETLAAKVESLSVAMVQQQTEKAIIKRWLDDEKKGILHCAAAVVALT
jgi:gamma-glutamyl:cysteine ligase YbdK (ATP-grasp superfamily)